jgi:transcriptional regulator with XRE-family HTH domain
MHIICTSALLYASKIFMSIKIDWKAVGRRLRELRGFDTSQANFARQLGISQGQLSRYEKGKSEIGAEVLVRISQHSGKSIEWVLTGKA